MGKIDKNNVDICLVDKTQYQNSPINMIEHTPIGIKKKAIFIHLTKKFFMKQSGHKLINIFKKTNIINTITNKGKSMFTLYDNSVYINL